MRWVALIAVLAITAFLVSAFVSRDECVSDSRRSTCQRGEVTYWWDR